MNIKRTDYGSIRSFKGDDDNFIRHQNIDTIEKIHRGTAQLANVIEMGDDAADNMNVVNQDIM